MSSEILTFVAVIPNKSYAEVKKSRSDNLIFSTKGIGLCGRKHHLNPKKIYRTPILMTVDSSP